MIEYLKSWYHRYFSDPQAALLAILLVLSFAVIMTMGEMLAPLLAAVIIAYLLEGSVYQMEKRGIVRILAVTSVFLVFLAFIVFLVLGLFPLLSRQLTEFFQEVPKMIGSGQELLLRLPEKYPQLISAEQVAEVIAGIKAGISGLGQNVVSYSLASIPAIITVLVYLILVPLLVFFFLKDKSAITAWLGGFLPRERRLVKEVWKEMDAQIGNYVRGKFYEIIIVGAVTYIVFNLMDLSYAPLLAVIVGLSVLIPYIGAAVVTLPVALVGYFQWGLSSEFAWLLVWYAGIQFLDGNVLVPILFSEALNLHPVAIIGAILVFGGLWGFWGVFFAIPLATLVKALINVWPRSGHEPGSVAAPDKPKADEAA